MVVDCDAHMNPNKKAWALNVQAFLLTIVDDGFVNKRLKPINRLIVMAYP